MAVTNPHPALESYRKSDAVVIVCQNNRKKMLEIAALNDEAVLVTGYSGEDIVGRPLSLLLPERISNTISEFIEYEEGKTDLLSILSKMNKFSIKNRDNREQEFRLRIISGEPVDRNPCFHMVLIDEEKTRDKKAFRAIIKENFKGHEVIDPRTDLPDRNSIIKDLELMIYYVHDKNIRASFAVVDINYYDKFLAEYGEQGCFALHSHISNIFKQRLRVEDTIGTLSERTLGMILVDASQEEARIVLNRLRWAISISPLRLKGEEVIAQVNICFSQIDGKVGNLELLRKCEEYMLMQREEAANSLHLVVATERRAREDRRKRSIPVAIDRRKHDRRVKRPQE